MSLYDERLPYVTLDELQLGNDTTWSDEYGPGNGPYRVDAAIITSTSVVDNVLEVAYKQGTSYYPIGAVTVPANAGNGTVPSVQALSTIAPSNIGGLYVDVNNSLAVRLATPLNSGESVFVTFLGGRL